MTEAGKALGSTIASTKPASAIEAEKTGDGTPATSPAAGDGAVASLDTVDEADSLARNTPLLESFRAELELYTSGDQVDVSPCYAAFEAVFRNPEVREMAQDARNSLMLMLMNSVEGETRTVTSVGLVPGTRL